jgi:hypothetical protein
MSIRLRAVLEMFTKGTDKAQKEVGGINQQLDQAADNAARMNKTLSQTRVGQGAMARAGVPDVSDTRTYRTQRGVTGARGAQGRDFAAMAQSGGGTGIVAAYAEVASTLFAVTAGFMALSNAAKVDQITKGLEIMGATAGVTLSNTAKGLQEVTGFGITAAESMRTVALATSAGFSKDEIEALGKVAKGASIALGRDLGDSMDRLIKGTVKLEPELLDELGIMVRLDDAVRDYALANNKTASSLTQLEKRQAFANAVAAEGLKKFGDLAENADANPYDKLAASVKELGTEVLSFINIVLKPFIDAMIAVPALALLPFTYLLQTVSSKLLPTFDSAMEKAGGTTEKYARKLTVIRDRSDEITGSMKAANDSLVAQGKAFSNLQAQPGMANRKSQIIGPGLVSPELSGISEKQLIKAIDEEILSIKQKLVTAEGAHTTRLTNQRDTLVSIKQKLTEIKKEHNEILRIRNQEIAAQAQLNAQTAQQGILTEFNSNVFSKGLLGATLTGLGDVWSGIIVPNFKEADKVGKGLNGTLTGTAIRFKALGIAAATAGRLIGMAFLQAIPIIGQLVMVGTIIFSIFAAFESEASKQKKKLLENLKSINENAKEVEKQIDKAFERRDYGAGFQAAINSLVEIVAALKEINDLANKPIAPQGGIKGSSWFDPAWLQKIFNTDAALAATGDLRARMDITKEEAAALNNIVSRAIDIKGLEYGRKVQREIIEAGKDYLPIVERESKSVEGIANSWSAVGEEASNAAKTLKKLYGKPITETEYTPVIASLISIQREANAITLAFKEAEADSTTAVAGIYSNIVKGGADFSAELDRINQDSSYSFSKTFNQYKALEAEIQAMRKAGAPEADVQKVINEQNILAGEAVVRLTEGELIIKGKIRDTEQFILDRRKAILDLTKKQNDLEKSIAQKVSDIAKDSRDIQRLRSFGTTEVSPATALQDELDNAKEKARIENIGYSTRAKLIALEFELEALKLQRAQITLENAVNTIAAFSSGANKTGKEIASEIFKGLGEDKSFDNFVKAIKSKTFLDPSTSFATTIDFSPEQINSLWDYATGLDYTAKSKEALAAISTLQTTLLGLETDANQSAVDVIQAKIEAYNSLRNIELRRIEDNKRTLDQAEQLLATERKTQESLIETERMLEDINRRRVGAPLPPQLDLTRQIEDQKTLIANLLQDRKNLEDKQQQTIATAGENLILSFKRYFDAKFDENIDPTVLQEAAENLTRARDIADAATIQGAATMKDFDAAMVKAKIALISLESSLATVDSVIRDAKNQGRDNLAISKAGAGMSLLGAGGTFNSLVEQAAKDQKYGGDISKLLADDEAMAKIRQASTEIEFMNIQAEGLKSTFENIRTGIEGAFMSIIDGSKNAKQAFGEMAAAIIKDIAAMIIKMLVFKTIEMGLNFLMPGLGIGVSTGASTAMHATPGSNIRGRANGGLIALANGGIMDARGGLQGIVSKPTYLVGEGRYNEAVVPLPNGKSIPVQMHGGGQSNNVAVNVNISNSGQVQTETQGQDMGNLGQAIAVAVQKELIAQKMPGGILNRYGAA